MLFSSKLPSPECKEDAEGSKQHNDGDGVTGDEDINRDNMVLFQIRLQSHIQITALNRKYISIQCKISCDTS